VDGQTWEASALQNHDLHFQTFVVPVPAPGTLMLGPE
jgi:hypothetical protein